MSLKASGKHSDALIEQQHVLKPSEVSCLSNYRQARRIPRRRGEGAVEVSWAVGNERFQSRLKSSQLEKGEKEE